jgi:pyrroline-5-carboxylate reductase
MSVNHAASISNAKPGLTLTVLGAGIETPCLNFTQEFLKLDLGTLGKAILRGILTSKPSPGEALPPRVPTHFIACVSRQASADSVRDELWGLTENLAILANENVRGARHADIVLLACKPQQVKAVLDVEGMREALRGKLLISILAGVPVSQIEDILYGGVSTSGDSTTGQSTLGPEDRCTVVRAMPNAASGIGESMTVIATSTPPLPPEREALVSWIFSKIGRTVQLAPSLMDASTALCASGPAFYALMLEAMADGGVAMGIPRKEAQFMAAQTMKGTAGLVLNGEHPALLRDKVSTPGEWWCGVVLFPRPRITWLNWPRWMHHWRTSSIGRR